MDVGSRLRRYVHPIESAAPRDGVADLRPVLDAVADARVMGLGEASHGTREFFQLRHRVCRGLVREQGVRLLALEADVAETLALDDYVARDDGDPADALAGLSYDHLATESMLAMLEWLRGFNEGRAANDRVRVYGIDTFSATGSASALVDYLDRVDTDYLASVRDDLETLERGLAPETGEGDTDESDIGPRLDATAHLVAALPDRLDQWEAEYVEASSDREWRLARHHARVVERAHEGWRRRMRGDRRGAFECREAGMAASVEWLLDNEPHDRVAVWAHNLHVGRSEVDLDPFDGRIETMGTMLDRTFGDDYYSMGFDFVRGSFRAIPADEATDESRAFSVTAPPTGTLAAELTGDVQPAGFLDLAAAARDADLAPWLSERPIHAIPGSYGASRDRTRTYDLPATFDGLLFVEETAGTSLVERD